jgi:hypothetical protein
MREGVKISASNGAQQNIGYGVGADPPHPATRLQRFEISVHEAPARQRTRTIALTRAEARAHRPWTQDGDTDIGTIGLQLERKRFR